MKTLLLSPILALVILLTGCSTVQNPQLSGDLAAIAGVAAYTGTAYYLNDHPDKRPIFEASKQMLDGLINAGNSDPIAFQKALANLPIKELKGNKGAIMVGAAVILWDSYAARATALDKSQQVIPVIVAVRDGIARALN